MTSHLNTNRIVWIDYIKAFSIMIVVALHVGIPDPYRTILRSFIIPLFFVLSGLFFNPKKYPTYQSFLKHKTLRLLIPYLLFNAITYIYWLLIAQHMGADSGTTIPFWRPLLGILLGLEHYMEHCKPLWFLPCLMVTEWIFYLCTRFFKNNLKKVFFNTLVISSLGFLLSSFHLPPLPYAIGGACSMTLFYFIGYIVRCNNDYLSILNGTIERSSITIWSLIWIITTGLCTFLSIQTEQTKVFENLYGNLLYAIPSAILGCISMMSFCIILYKLLPNLKILLYIGTHTLTILAFHLMLAGWIKGITYFIFRLPMDIYHLFGVQLIFVLAIIIGSIPLCYTWDWVTKKVEALASTLQRNTH